MPGRDAQRVYITTLRINAQSKRAERAHFAPHFLRHLLGHIFAYRDLLDPLCKQLIDPLEHVHPVPEIRVRLEHIVFAERLFQLVR